MRALIVLLILALQSPLAKASQESIGGFNFSACHNSFCYKVTAVKASRSYFANYFVLEGGVSLEAIENGKFTKFEAPEALFDPGAVYFILRRDQGDVIVEPLNQKITEL